LLIFKQLSLEAIYGLHSTTSDSSLTSVQMLLYAKISYIFHMHRFKDVSTSSPAIHPTSPFPHDPLLTSPLPNTNRPKRYSSPRNSATITTTTSAQLPIDGEHLQLSWKSATSTKQPV
jgi:hypothetical protein